MDKFSILNKYNISQYESRQISNTELKIILEIDKLIDIKLTCLNDHLNMINKFKLNITTVSNEINISRTTLYKYNLISRIIEHGSDMLKKTVDSFIIETDKGKELTFQIKQLMKRDNEIMRLRQENENLRLKLIDLERTIIKIRNRN